MKTIIEKYKKFVEIIGNGVKEGEELHHYTSFKVGGKADLFYSAKDEKSLHKAVKTAKELNIPLVLIGSGKNILISDEGFRGLVIRNECKERINLFDDYEIFVYAGVELSKTVEFAAENSLSGLEFASGIPGSVGGAVYMNAGAYGSSISELVVTGKLIDKEGNICELNREEFKFDYRYSRLQETGEILISVVIALKNGERDEILRKMNEIIEIRKTKHPSEDIPCAGSYFKNISREGTQHVSAGYYLDKAGAKDFKVGGAKVFYKHANFIINTGNATASDILKLAGIMKKSVKEKFGIELIEEVVYLDEKEGFRK